VYYLLVYDSKVFLHLLLFDFWVLVHVSLLGTHHTQLSLCFSVVIRCIWLPRRRPLPRSFEESVACALFQVFSFHRVGIEFLLRKNFAPVKDMATYSLSASLVWHTLRWGSSRILLWKPPDSCASSRPFFFAVFSVLERDDKAAILNSF
jgi:hypothetical protein